ncbi:MAG: methyl-accepting chemotaxis protein, partial [Candidatus Aenigmarchaeota archaeon]|nr:methyl-accepting chemotaxis protein [Candidatus Aenigmarchaeota archaeon]
MKWFYDLKIAVKLLTGFVLVAVIAAVIGFMGYNAMNTMKKGENEISIVRLPSIEALLEIYQAQTDVDSAENALLTEELVGAGRKEQYERISDAFKRADSAWKVYEPLPQTDEEKKVWEKFVPAWERWKKDDQDYLNLSREFDLNKSPDIHKKMIEQALVTNAKSFSEVSTLMKQLIKINKDVAVAAHEGSDEAFASTSTLLIVTIVFGILLAVGLGIFISRIISRPLGKMVAVANKIADGNLDVLIDIKTKDEIGVLAKAFDTMADNLNNVMGNINSSAEQVSAGSRQVSSSSQALSQGATEQASSIEEITSAMTEVAAQTKQNALSANQANEFAETAKDRAKEGNIQMQDMLKSMQEINDSSSNISKIIKVIDEIAFQTNILAPVSYTHL